MANQLTGQRLLSYLLLIEDYDIVITKFNYCTHDEKFDALDNENFRGYLSRATRHRGSITAGRTAYE